MKDTVDVDNVQVYLDLAVALRHWKPQIVEALEYAKHTHSFNDVVAMVMNGQCALYGFPDAFMLMEECKYPQFKTWHCFLAGGNHDTIVATEDYMKEQALIRGCKYLSYSGRKGWDRDARKRDWEFVCTTMYKLVEGGGNG